MAQRMINMVGVDSVHGSVRSSKLRATTRAGPINFGVGTGRWARGNVFLGGQCSMGVL
jgi:hypothetical protein